MWSIEWTDDNGTHKYKQGSQASVMAWANHLGHEGIEVIIQHPDWDEMNREPATASTK